MFKNVARTTDKENTHGGPHGDADDFPDEEVDAVGAAYAAVIARCAGAHGVLTPGEASRCVFWTWRSADNSCLRGEKNDVSGRVLRGPLRSTLVPPPSAWLRNGANALLGFYNMYVLDREGVVYTRDVIGSYPAHCTTAVSSSIVWCFRTS